MRIIHTMKLSLSWIFDHIEADYTKIDIADLVRQFNKITAEIETFYPVSFAVDRFVWGRILKIDASGVVIQLKESQEIMLPYRSDLILEEYVLVYHYEHVYRWATLIDFGSQKEALLPMLEYDPKALLSLELHDYIIEIDNKSITHRPDMWGHRGVAREIAAILDLSLKPLERFLAEKDAIVHENMRASLQEYTVSVDPFSGCYRFAVASGFVKKVPLSSLWMAVRLAKVDSKPMNGIVDATNYVMFDLGHPMHAFDAKAFESKSICVGRAQADETIVLLDDQQIVLTPDDIVVLSATKPVSLAGIMGGKNSAVSLQTTHIIVEAALFDGATIRKSALRHKKRTESSARFEKELDPNAIIAVIQRYIKLLQGMNIAVQHFSSIACLGKQKNSLDVSVAHSYLQSKLGIVFEQKEVISIFERLSCVVQTKREASGDLVYEVTVPTFRTTKDITMKDDLVEEVGRFIGYDMIVPSIPFLPSKPKELQKIQALRRMRSFLTIGLHMHEIGEYAFFDEQFLGLLEWEPCDAASVINPVSENWKRLVTTLIPNLLKAVSENSAQTHKMRFFEYGKSWTFAQNTVIESQKVAGIFFDAMASEDFYTGKTCVDQLCQELGYSVTWHPVLVAGTTAATWFEPYQVGYVMHNNKRLGIAGMVSQSWVKKIAPKGSAFIFEFDGDILLQQVKQKRFVPLVKYPIVERDVSIMISSQTTAAVIKQLILGVDQRVKKVDLVDFFEKPEWHNIKAMTYRVSLYDEYKTLSGKEVDCIMQSINDLLIKQGANIR